ncbi:MAG: hypothetical protein ACFFAS_13375 [Promethearchaeota archaeon]
MYLLTHLRALEYNQFFLINICWFFKKSDLASIGLSNEQGIEYNISNFEALCEQIYSNVKQFYSQNAIFKVKKAELADEPAGPPETQLFEWEDFANILERILESDNLQYFHANNKSAITTLLQQLKKGVIDDGAFMLQISQSFSTWLMMRESQKC